MEPLFEKTFFAAELMVAFAPKLQDRNKRIVFQIACPAGSEHSETISFARYPCSSLPVSISGQSDTVLELHEGVFTYPKSPAHPEYVEWHMNFANRDLFGAYGARAFAQDELQVAEHPALGVLREALLASARAQLFTVEQDQPTPIVIMGVERRCEIATAPNAAAGRSKGLYGRAFSVADPEVVRAATHQVIPPTMSNILAIEAPANGTGCYTPGQIEFILKTAYSGFRAVRVETERKAGNRAAIVIHTGYWGCGAYGNDRVLMALLQFLAARLAGVNRLVFHSVDASGSAVFRKAKSIMEKLLGGGGVIQRLIRSSPKECDLADVLRQIDVLGFRWGEGDGN